MKLVFGIVFTVFLLESCAPQVDISTNRLTVNFKENPVGINAKAPLFAWQIVSSQYNVRQSAYRILVAETPEDLSGDNGSVWDSGKINSEESINIPYQGKALSAGNRYCWKVKIWDENGLESSWSEIQWWQNGLFSSKDWQGAKWVAAELLDEDLRLVPGIHGSGDDLGNKALQRPVVPQFRKQFELKKGIKHATLSISGLGHYVVFLNGKKPSDSFLAPGWTDYDKTVFYNTYDVTPFLKSGNNVLGAVVGNGFFNINRERYCKLVIAYGMPQMIAHLQVEYTDGTSETIVTDESWKTAPSPITFSSIYAGEDYDATLEQDGWKETGFDDKSWESVKISRGPGGSLVAENDYPLKEMERIEVKLVSKLADGSFLYDFGQNASGIVQLSVKGKRGQQIKLWPAELINTDSTANQKASGAPYYFSYTLKGDGVETWKPEFTYYGFRYVQVEGGVPAGEENAGELPQIDQLTFVHTRNSSPTNGTFECSSELLNNIHELIDWGIRSNYQSVLSDCPHREKLGWLEQSFLMGQGVHFRYENYHLYRKLVADMMDAQTADGLVPDIAPEYVEFLGGFRDSPEWGSAAVILPYLLFKWYGDKQVIDEAWPMMVRYVEYLKGKSQGHILDHGLGDWFDLGPESPGKSQLTPISLTATAIYYYDVKLMAKMAKLLKKQEERKLHQWAEEIRSAFNTKFFDAETKVYSTGSQTAMAMPLCVGIPEENDRAKIFENLVDSIIAGNKALTAGDVGFHYLVEALTRGGAAQLMFDMINRDDVPGYGYQLKKGATALTESWAALEVVSNNHLMLGHVMEWFYTGLGGIGQAEDSKAYKKIVIEPQLVNDLTFVKTSFQSPYGLIRSQWEKSGSDIQFEIEIPHNTAATFVLPTGNVSAIIVNGEKPAANALHKTEEEKTGLLLGSGVYQISCKYQN
ncbi:family 78 glycoside hydrolase catalytic domain [Mariniphaga anaerophila]|uniref:family 78 glycoside hydrolase catalytic domain n=1 Tax=Mariniphaga anaerophila TaxID=1484053 RepID=UPI001C318E8E|nr:family 78 glycoside hydrolase catalytic domain [Mariniphaga anaerophila]